MSHRFLSRRSFARAVAAGFLGLVGMSLGCDKSPSAPTPSAEAPFVTPPVVVTAGIILTASPSLVMAGNQLTVTWVGPSGRGCSGGGDWIAMYKVGDPDVTGATNGHSDLWFVHVCGAISGTSTLSAPPEPGEYEFRFMEGDTAVARSGPVTVSASTSPPPVVPTLTVDGATESSRKVGETFWVTGIGYTPGGTVTRYLNPPVNGLTAITPLTADRLGNLSWAFTPTCGSFNPAVSIYAVDVATGRTSNAITETVTGKCP